MRVIRNVLVVGNGFANYDHQIQQVYSSLGISADLIQYNGNVPNRFKYGNTIFSFLFYYLVFLLNFIKMLKLSLFVRNSYSRYDMVLIINGGFLLPFVFSRVRRDNFFVWIMDPVDKFPSVIKLSRYGFRVFSYSEDDVRKYSFNFLPLFVPPDFVSNQDIPDRYEYDLAFVGAIDTHRLFLLNYFTRFFQSDRIYLGGVFGRFNIASLLLKFDRGLSSFKSVFKIKYHSSNEIISIYRNSKLIANPNVGDHTGASMRVYECLSLGTPQLLGPDVYRSRYFGLVCKLDTFDTILGPAFTRSQPLNIFLSKNSLSARVCRLNKVFLRLHG